VQKPGDFDRVQAAVPDRNESNLLTRLQSSRNQRERERERKRKIKVRKRKKRKRETESEIVEKKMYYEENRKKEECRAERKINK
jgi:hypothetical protein